MRVSQEQIDDLNNWEQSLPKEQRDKMNEEIDRCIIEGRKEIKENYLNVKFIKRINGKMVEVDENGNPL